MKYNKEEKPRWVRPNEVVMLQCPHCKVEHKRKPTGEYCNMTCYYAKLRRDMKW